MDAAECAVFQASVAFSYIADHTQDYGGDIFPRTFTWASLAAVFAIKQIKKVADC